MRFVRHQQFLEQPDADIEQHAADEKFEHLRIGKIQYSEIIPDEYAGQCARDDHPGERPCHAAFLDITIYAAGYGNDIKNMIRPAHGRSGVIENAHLERKKKKGAGNAPHGSEEGNDERNQRREQHIRGHARNGKRHGQKIHVRPPL